MQSVREPAVAGTFYPNDPATLSALIDTFLVDETQVADGARVKHPKAIIAPHAGMSIRVRSPVRSTVN